MTVNFPHHAPTFTLTYMPNRAANVLAAVGSLLLVAAVVVPAIMWPRPAELDVPLRQVAALAVGGVLLLAGVVCWVGAVLAKRR